MVVEKDVSKDTEKAVVKGYTSKYPNLIVVIEGKIVAKFRAGVYVCKDAELAKVLDKNPSVLPMTSEEKKKYIK